MTPYHDPTGDEMEHKYFCYLADKFEADPSLLERPVRTIQRWLSIDHHGAHALLKWRQLIEAAMQSAEGMKSLVTVLRADDEETRCFKGFAPFPGILTREERRQFLCDSRH
jgi:hypothetical protein